MLKFNLISFILKYFIIFVREIRFGWKKYLGQLINIHHYHIWHIFQWSVDLINFSDTFVTVEMNLSCQENLEGNPDHDENVAAALDLGFDNESLLTHPNDSVKNDSDSGKKNFLGQTLLSYWKIILENALLQTIN